MGSKHGDDTTIVIYGDTEALDLMSDINEALADHGLVFEDITKDGSDQVEFQLQHLEDDEDDHDHGDEDD